MQTTTSKLKKLLQEVQEFVRSCPEEQLIRKPSEKKWSKKEILGHLVDSALYNLQRFIEIQFEPKPYPIGRYKQDECVKANNYQHLELEGILELWLVLNRRILNVIDLQTAETLKYNILLDNGEQLDLKFLMEDYVQHMEHHVRQIVS